VPALPLVPLAVAGALGGFLAGRVFGQPEGGGPATAGGGGAPAADSSLAGSTSDVWDSWGTASLNFAGMDGAGSLAGVLPIPPGTVGEPPPPAPAPAPTAPPPSSSTTTTAIACWPGHTRPPGAVGWVTISSSHFRLWTYSGGYAYPGPYGSLSFSAWDSASVTLRTASGSATFRKILSGVHAGKYFHTSDAGITYHACPAGSV
jgi:hypothetical protein